jgi:hypothetical protein
MHYVTWQPEIAEAGHYFLTAIQAPAKATIAEIMAACHAAEDIETLPYTLCSIVYVSPETMVTVIY